MHMLTKENGFTLMETLVVIIIIGILSVIGITQYGSYKENVVEREAKENLKLIRAAQRIYRMESSTYYPASGVPISDIATINTNLKLDIPAGPQRNWNYSVRNDGCGIATRLGGSTAYSLAINDADQEPNKNGTCN